MTADQGLGFDDHEGPPPIEQARPEDERETGRVAQSSRLRLPLFIESKLLAQEQDFCAQGCSRTDRQNEKTKSLCDQIGDQGK